MTGNKSFKEALKKGIPIEVRGEVWAELLGNPLRVTIDLYNALLKRVRLA